VFLLTGGRVAHGHNKGCREIIKKGFAERVISKRRRRKTILPDGAGQKEYISQ